MICFTALILGQVVYLSQGRGSHASVCSVVSGRGCSGWLSTWGANSNATVTLDLVADGGAGNQIDDGVLSGVVSGHASRTNRAPAHVLDVKHSERGSFGLFTG